MNKYQEALDDIERRTRTIYTTTNNDEIKVKPYKHQISVLQELIDKHQNLINAINIIKKDKNISYQDDDKWDWLMEYLESEKEKEWIER